MEYHHAEGWKILRPSLLSLRKYRIRMEVGGRRCRNPSTERFIGPAKHRSDGPDRSPPPGDKIANLPAGLFSF
jgi:hypothetical protein